MENHNTTTPANEAPAEHLKFCKHCGGKIPEDAVICTLCGRQVESIRKDETPNIIINNSNTSSNVNTNVNNNVNGFMGRPKNKWVSLVLCFFLGVIGAHKFYEGKTGMGLLYLFTGGLFFVGVVIDFIALLGKPNPYYV